MSTKRKALIVVLCLTLAICAIGLLVACGDKTDPVVNKDNHFYKQQTMHLDGGSEVLGLKAVTIVDEGKVTFETDGKVKLELKVADSISGIINSILPIVEDGKVVIDGTYTVSEETKKIELSVSILGLLDLDISANYTLQDSEFSLIFSILNEIELKFNTTKNNSAVELLASDYLVGSILNIAEQVFGETVEIGLGAEISIGEMISLNGVGGVKITELDILSIIAGDEEFDRETISGSLSIDVPEISVELLGRAEETEKINLYFEKGVMYITSTSLFEPIKLDMFALVDNFTQQPAEVKTMSDESEDMDIAEIIAKIKNVITTINSEVVVKTVGSDKVLEYTIEEGIVLQIVYNANSFKEINLAVSETVNVKLVLVSDFKVATLTKAEKDACEDVTESAIAIAEGIMFYITDGATGNVMTKYYLNAGITLDADLQINGPATIDCPLCDILGAEDDCPCCHGLEVIVMKGDCTDCMGTGKCLDRDSGEFSGCLGSGIGYVLDYEDEPDSCTHCAENEHGKPSGVCPKCDGTGGDTTDVAEIAMVDINIALSYDISLCIDFTSGINLTAFIETTVATKANPNDPGMGGMIAAIVKSLFTEGTAVLQIGAEAGHKVSGDDVTEYQLIDTVPDILWLLGLENIAGSFASNDEQLLRESTEESEGLDIIQVLFNLVLRNFGLGTPDVIMSEDGNFIVGGEISGTQLGGRDESVIKVLVDMDLYDEDQLTSFTLQAELDLRVAFLNAAGQVHARITELNDILNKIANA